MRIGSATWMSIAVTLCYFASALRCLELLVVIDSVHYPRSFQHLGNLDLGTYRCLVSATSPTPLSTRLLLLEATHCIRLHCNRC